ITAKKDISSFYFMAGDFELQNGTGKIDKSNIEVLAERYIEVKAPSSQSKQAAMFSGWYPDALVPIDAYIATRENKIKSGNNQGIWINVSIPCDAVAGNYIANCTLTLDGIDVNVPIEVKVFDIAMPENNNVKTAFAIWFDQIGKGEIYEDEDGYPIDWDEIYYEFLLSKRITPLTSLTLSSTPSESNYNTLVNEIVRLTRDKRVACFDLPYGQEGHPDYGKVINKSTMVGLLTAMAEKNMELVDGGEDINLFEKAFYYFGSIIDEPSVSKLDAVKYCDLCVTQAKQEVAVLLADYPELQASLLAMQHVITTKVSDAFAGNETEGGVQTWCCEAQNYTKTDLLSIKERQESTERYSQGEGFWIYTTCNSNNPYPSLQLDDTLLSRRVIYWMMNNYDMMARSL
ncbi:MAG: hypothetical protein MJ193_04850, partial [Clostridia bacterium]|nr:hypothetical protein [Clostridia bacterium]